MNERDNINPSTADGPDLDYLVALIDPSLEELTFSPDEDGNYLGVHENEINVIIPRMAGCLYEQKLSKKYRTGNAYLEFYKPSRDLTQGGRIIEREKIATSHFSDTWHASRQSNIFADQIGDTHIQAAMRCYVSKAES